VGVTSATASGPSPFVKSDPTGDVVGSVTDSQGDTVDLTNVSYTIDNTTLTITTRVVDLAQTPGNQFASTKVFTVDGDFTLVSTLGEKPVLVATGSTLSPCKNASTTFSYANDVVRQTVPLKCIGTQQFRLKSSSFLARNNGTELAKDSARRTTELFASEPA
jgi:hypothetical protein